MHSQALTRRAFWLGVACAVAVLAIWTSFILIARFSATRTLSPFDIAFVRFVFSGLVVLPFVLGRLPALRDALGDSTASALWRGAALSALAGVGYCALAYSAFFYAPVAHGAVLLPGSLPLLTTLAAMMLLHEKVSPARALGLALIIAGDLLVGGHSLLQAFDGGQVWKGDLLFLGAACCWSTYTVLCRKWQLGAVPATAAIALGCLLSAVPLYGLAVAAGWVPSRLAQASWTEIGLQAVYQGGFSMLLAGLAFTQVVRTFGPVRTTMVTALVPVLAALGGVALLGEALTGFALAGLVCVTGGLLLGLRVRSVAPLALQGRPA